MTWNRAFIVLVSIGSLAAYAAQQSSAFEVASIKEQPWVKNEYTGFACRGTDGVHGMPFGNRGFSNISIPLGRCRGEFTPLAQVIGFAYGVLARDVVGGPDWIRTPFEITFQIDAKAEDTGTATTDQLRIMLQSILKERFKLGVHDGTRDVSGYALTLGKNGSHKLKEASATSAAFSLAGPGLFSIHRFTDSGSNRPHGPVRHPPHSPVFWEFRYR